MKEQNEQPAATEPPQILTRATADKVLLADLANILKKAKSGKPLTKYERELIRSQATNRSQPGEETEPAEFTAVKTAAGTRWVQTTPYKHPEKYYAERDKCDVRTIRNWKKEGAPLDDPSAMNAWLAGRKNVPPGMATTNAGEHHSELQPIELELNQDEGPAAALTRLAEAELNAARNYQQASNSGDPLQAKNALNAWLETLDSLRKYDAQIESGRRDSGDLIPRAELERILRAAAFYLRIAGQQVIEAACDTPAPIWRVKEEWEMNQLLRRLYWETLMNTFASLAAHTDGKEMEIPRWAIQAISSDLEFVLKDVPEIIQKRAAAINELIAHNARATSEKATRRKA